MPVAAGYMMMAGHFSRNLVSSGDLNRGSQGLPRVFLRYFLHVAKSTNPFPCRELRGFANLDSAHRSRGFARTKLKPSQKKLRGFANLESAHPKQRLRTNPIKSFCRPRRHFSVAAATFFCRSAAYPPPCGGFFFLLFVKYKK